MHSIESKKWKLYSIGPNRFLTHKSTGTVRTIWGFSIQEVIYLSESQFDTWCRERFHGIHSSGDL